MKLQFTKNVVVLKKDVKMGIVFKNREFLVDFGKLNFVLGKLNAGNGDFSSSVELAGFLKEHHLLTEEFLEYVSE